MKPVEEFLKNCLEIHDGITEGSYGQIPRGTRCTLAEVSVKISEGIMGGILGILGTKPETITIGTLQDAHDGGETPGEVPCGISERIFKEVPE